MPFGRVALPVGRLELAEVSTVEQMWPQACHADTLHSLQSTRVEMASHKRQTYQNEAKNLCTIYV